MAQVVEFATRWHVVLRYRRTRGGIQIPVLALRSKTMSRPVQVGFFACCTVARRFMCTYICRFQRACASYSRIRFTGRLRRADLMA
jgi:hypothetical protein